MPKIGKMSINIESYLYFCDEGRNKKAAEILNKLIEEMDFIDIGTYRACFKMEDGRVLKFPISEAGEYCNDGEASWKHETFAEGEYLVIDDFVCVIQEFIEPMSYEQIKKLGKVPDWVAGIDSGQVGMSKDGRLKAYDFVHP